jgi:cation transport protein ChaC
MVFRVPAAEGLATLARLWLREMPTGVYDPRWLDCITPGGRVRALAFTLSRRSPNFTGVLSDAHYRDIFARAVGRYGSSIDYARQTLQELRRHAIHDTALARLVNLAESDRPDASASPDCRGASGGLYQPTLSPPATDPDHPADQESS